MTAVFNCFFYRNKPKGLYTMKYNIVIDEVKQKHFKIGENYYE